MKPTGPGACSRSGLFLRGSPKARGRSFVELVLPGLSSALDQSGAMLGEIFVVERGG